MRKHETARAKEARKKAMLRFDHVLDVYETLEFVEVTGLNGGDVIQMRYYDDGREVER